MTTHDDKAREAVARAIWSIRREDEDRCDMELEDMGLGHSVWREADAVLATLSPASSTGQEAVGYMMVHESGGDVGFAWKADSPMFPKQWKRVPLFAAPAQQVAEAEIRDRALEEAARACEDERLGDSKFREDAAYNLAIEHCTAAIRSLKSAAGSNNGDGERG